MLEKELFDKYQVILKQACLNILKCCAFSEGNGEITVRISDKKQDEIARFITFGNGKTHGSRILINALR